MGGSINKQNNGIDRTGFWQENYPIIPLLSPWPEINAAAHPNIWINCVYSQRLTVRKAAQLFVRLQSSPFRWMEVQSDATSDNHIQPRSWPAIRRKESWKTSAGYPPHNNECAFYSAHFFKVIWSIAFLSDHIFIWSSHSPPSMWFITDARA